MRTLSRSSAAPPRHAGPGSRQDRPSRVCPSSGLAGWPCGARLLGVALGAGGAGVVGAVVGDGPARSRRRWGGARPARLVRCHLRGLREPAGPSSPLSPAGPGPPAVPRSRRCRPRPRRRPVPRKRRGLRSGLCVAAGGDRGDDLARRWAGRLAGVASAVQRDSGLGRTRVDGPAARGARAGDAEGDGLDAAGHDGHRTEAADLPLQRLHLRTVMSAAEAWARLALVSLATLVWTSSTFVSAMLTRSVSSGNSSRMRGHREQCEDCPDGARVSVSTERCRPRDRARRSMGGSLVRLLSGVPALLVSGRACCSSRGASDYFPSTQPTMT